MQADIGDEAAIARAQALVEALRAPACYPHPVGEVEVHETHISWVLLAGAFAYKIKKPVRLPFLDFSTLERRQHFCREELRVNRRLAPALYLDVVPIVLGDTHPAMGGTGPVAEYAVRMARFPSDGQLDVLADTGALEVAHVTAAARVAARFHGTAAVAGAGGRFGAPAQLHAEAMDNFDALDGLADAAGHRVRLAGLRRWTERSLETHADTFAARRAGGMVRECHGDMHLANMALFSDEPRRAGAGERVIIFDGIEFDERLRWIDVMSEIAFAVMDLHHRQRPAFATSFLNTYLDESGDHQGLALLPHYLVYRALVRAKVAGFRASELAGDARQRAVLDLGAHVQLAERLAAGPAQPALCITHGVSGSGKSWLSEPVAAQLGAVRLRSDVERARGRAGPAGRRTPPAPGTGDYRPAARDSVYEHLAGLATIALRAGFPVLVDATFLERRRRRRFQALAAGERVPFAILACTASAETLAARVERRLAAGADPSEATPEVLRAQLAGAEPLLPEEAPRAVVVETSDTVAPECVAQRLRACLAASPGAP